MTTTAQNPAQGTRSLAQWRSPILRRAVLLCLAAWAPGALLTTLLHGHLWSTFLATEQERLDEEVETVTWTIFETEFLLHHSVEDEEALDEEELDAWVEERLEELEDGATLRPELVEAAFEAEGILEELETCARLEDSGGNTLAANLGEVLGEIEIGAEINARLARMRVPQGLAEELEDPDTLEIWCFLRRVELAGGSSLVVGHPVGETYRPIRRAAWTRDVLLLLGLPLALVLGWLQARPLWHFLGALGKVARRQEADDVRARLHSASFGGEIRDTARAVDRMLDRLEQRAQGLSKVSDSIAHDLRTPLARLQGQLDLLKQASAPSDELIEAIQAESDQLLATFNALLRITRIESGEKKKGFRTFDLTAVAQNVVDLYAPVFADAGIDFAIQLPHSRVDQLGDADLWTQALSNLVENALKYTPREGAVELELHGGQHPRLVVQDSGPGIPEAERDNVFRRFYRLERHRGERGSGLGLTLVAAVCELHGARIRLGEPEGRRGLKVEISL